MRILWESGDRIEIMDDSSNGIEPQGLDELCGTIIELGPGDSEWQVELDSGRIVTVHEKYLTS